MTWLGWLWMGDVQSCWAIIRRKKAGRKSTLFHTNHSFVNDYGFSSKSNNNLRTVKLHLFLFLRCLSYSFSDLKRRWLKPMYVASSPFLSWLSQFSSDWGLTSGGPHQSILLFHPLEAVSISPLKLVIRIVWFFQCPGSPVFYSPLSGFALFILCLFYIPLSIT